MNELINVVTTIGILVGIWKLDAINKSLGTLTKGLDVLEEEVSRLRDRVHELAQELFAMEHRHVREKHRESNIRSTGTKAPDDSEQ